MSKVTVMTTADYEPRVYDGVLVKERTIVCLDADGAARVVPLHNVSYVDADEDLLVSGENIVTSFYGGGQYGFLDTRAFPRATLR